MPDRVMVSASEEAFGLAIRELKGAFGGRLDVERAGPDLGVVTVPGVGVGQVARCCEQAPLVFIRHLSVEVARLDLTAPLEDVARVASGGLRGAGIGPDVAVQAWQSEIGRAHV